MHVPDLSRGELARQVVVDLGAGLAAGYAGPLVGALATGAVPVVQLGMDYIARAIGSRRIEHASETLEDAADVFGAETPEEFIEFVKAAVSDAEHQELLARALTVAQDAAMRDKRRALGRALASATRDRGTRVDEEMLFIRVLDELDAPHIRLLRLMSTPPPSLDELNRLQRIAVGEPPIRQWHPPEVAELDPGLGEVMYGLFPVLSRLRLIDGNDAEYTINAYGEWVLDRLTEPNEVVQPNS
jgi:hypothetical protein